MYLENILKVLKITEKCKRGVSVNYPQGYKLVDTIIEKPEIS